MIWISIIFIVMLIAIIALSVWKGLKKDLIQGGLCLIFNILAMIFAFLISKPVTSGISGNFIIPSLASVSADMQQVFDEQMSECVSAAISSAVVPLTFIIFYIVFYFIFKIPLYFAETALSKKLEDKNISNTAGTLVCFLLNGILLFFFIAAPLSAYNTLASAVSEEFETQASESSLTDVVSSLDIVIQPLSNDISLKVVSAAGGNGFSRLLCSYRTSHGKISIPDEAKPLATLLANATVFLETSPSKYGTAQTTAVANMRSAFNNSNLIPAFFAELLSSACEYWSKGETYAGVAAPKTEPRVNAVLQDCYRIYSEPSPSNIRNDFASIASLLTLAVENNIITQTDTVEMVKKLGQPAQMSIVYTTVYDNPRLRLLIPDVTYMGLGLVGDMFNADIDAIELPETDMSTVTRENILAEAACMSEVLLRSMDFNDVIEVTGADENSMISLKLLGDAFFALKDSIFLGPVDQPIFVQILKTDSVRSIKLVNDTMIAKVSANEDLDIPNLLYSSDNAILLIYDLSNRHEIPYDDIHNALVSLITEMLPDSCDIIKSMITAQVVSEEGNTLNDSTQMVKVIYSMLDNMSEIEEITEEQAHFEADACQILLTLMKEANSRKTYSDIFASTGISAERMLDYFVDSEIITETLAEIDYDANGNVVNDPLSLGKTSQITQLAVKAAATAYYNQNVDNVSDKTSFRNRVINIALIFGVDLRKTLK